MNRYRQNTERRNSNHLNGHVMEEYGIKLREMKTDRKELRSKSKSKNEILIAKNKKLPQSFTPSKPNLHKQKSPNLRESKSNQKQHHFFQIWQKNSTYTREQQNDLNGMQTSTFGFDPKIDKENMRLKSSRQIVIKPQTYFSDKVEAFELKQRLKKSTSMKNLIEQRFMYGTENQKSQPLQSENNQNLDAKKQYDSTKYNWRLSKSKEKLEKQKSLSLLGSKVKIMHDLQKIPQHQNKLTLSSSREPNNENVFKLKTQQILSYDYNPQKTPLQSSRKRLNPTQNLSYTFGSDVINSIHFS